MIPVALLRSASIFDRRKVIQRAAAGVLAGTVGRRLNRVPATPSRVPDAVADLHAARSALVDPALVHTLAMTALDAARSAGATYADVRLTRTIDEHFQVPWDVIELGVKSGSSAWWMNDGEHVGLGVRALVNGYWGFSATPYWTADEAARVATSAVGQATTNAKGPSRSVVLDQRPVVTGSWRTPVAIDPFRISMEEKLDFMKSTIVTAKRMIPRRFSRGNIDINPGVAGRHFIAEFSRQEQVLATTDGSYVTQTLYRSQGDMPLTCTFSSGNVITGYSIDGTVVIPAQGLAESGRGWEMFLDAKLLDQVPGMLAELELRAALPVKAAEVGRYDIVCDAATMAGVIDATLGRATEVDRALGYEANAGGTSYLGPDPLTVLGTAVASPLVTVTANRSLATGLATVQWDAEGVVPKEFPLVRDGILVDYQTTREQAAWLAPWYARSGAPVHSHGCAAATDALSLTLQMTPNLTLAPVPTGAGFESLVSTLSDGIVVENALTETDFQCRNGTIKTGMPGRIFQVKGGKRVARLTNAGVIFSTSELWKNVTALGDSASVEHLRGTETKGEPSQSTSHTVSTVPAAIKTMAVIDITKKA